MKNISLTQLIMTCLKLPRIGPKTTLHYLQKYNNLQLIVHKMISKFGVTTWNRCFKLVTTEIEHAKASKINILNYQEASYPQSLLTLANFPLILYAKGNIGLLNQKKIALIGTRKPTRIGIKQGQKVTKYLVEIGYVIVSGLAKGCDTCAHRTCLNNEGQTIAVLAAGLDQPVYPQQNRQLAADIIKNKGLLISTYPLGTKLRPQYLAARDEWQSGIGDGVIVIETGRAGGTNITMNFCLKQHRPLARLDTKITKSVNNTVIWPLHSENDIQKFVKLLESTK
ncbi:hypothetical protein LCR01_12260 [Companilactobacillus crustorum]|uniref:DNA-processing protein DprA n=2 Tax=Companilactobacillus TaxID=2767879 RepID=A0A2P4R9E2_9LACO|nr:DNA-processing protein DprA [Companilactobacillus crustorum]GEO76783.1 hypothetical protein LCR01_12260 [Companilactobacillus crustorum]HCD07742.1 DNA-processing protein DprA [Lactobacillus sp.]